MTTTTTPQKAKFSSIIKHTFLSPFEWDARTTSRSYWIGWSITAIINIIPAWYLSMAITVPLVLFLSFGPMEVDPSYYIVVGITLVFEAYIVACQAGLGIRRLHDTGKSGWWFLLNFVPYVGWIIMIPFMIQPATEKQISWKKYLD